MTQDTTPPANPYNITSLLVEIGAARVEIHFGEEFSLTVSDNTQYESTVENGTWIIRGKPEGMRWMLGEQTTRYVVSLPHGTVLEALALDIGAGLLSADGLQTKSAKLHVGAGKMDLKNLLVAETCTTEVGAGVLSITGALAGRAKVHCGMGITDLRLARPNDFGYRAQCAMGSIKVDGVATAGIAGEHKQNETAATFYDLECGMGSVNVQFG